MCLALAFDNWVTVCLVPTDTRACAAVQPCQILALFDDYLSEAGTNKRHIRSLQVWLATLDDYAAVKAQLGLWLDAHSRPAVTCMRADMARPDIAVEIRIIADR